MKVRINSCGYGEYIKDPSPNKINVNGRDYGPTGRGINIARIDPKTGQLKDGSVLLYDTHGDDNAGSLLHAFVQQHIKENTIWVVIAIDEASRKLGSGLQSLQMLGSKSVSNMGCRQPFVFCAHISGSTKQVLCDEVGARDSRITRTVEVITEDEKNAAAAQQAAIAHQAAIANAQAEVAREKEKARQNEIKRLEAERKQKEAEEKAQKEREKAEKERLAREEEKLREHLEKCEQVAASQEKGLREVFPSLRDTVSFLRNMDRRKLITEETLLEMEEQLSTMENASKLKI